MEEWKSKVGDLQFLDLHCGEEEVFEEFELGNDVVFEGEVGWVVSPSSLIAPRLRTLSALILFFFSCIPLYKQVEDPY